jgi:hypothetical protein
MTLVAVHELARLECLIGDVGVADARRNGIGRDVHLRRNTAAVRLCVVLAEQLTAGVRCTVRVVPLTFLASHTMVKKTTFLATLLTAFLATLLATLLAALLTTLLATLLAARLATLLAALLTTLLAGFTTAGAANLLVFGTRCHHTSQASKQIATAPAAIVATTAVAAPVALLNGRFLIRGLVERVVNVGLHSFGLFDRLGVCGVFGVESFRRRFFRHLRESRRAIG